MSLEVSEEIIMVSRSKEEKLYKTVEKAIARINRRVEKETGNSILDFLYDATDNYEFNEDGEKSTCDYIIRGLENEADMYMDLIKEEKGC